MFAASKTASVSGGYQISRSLRFNSADSTNVQRTFSTTGTSQTTSTLSMWFKRGDISRNQRIFDCYDGSSGSSTGIFLDNDVITLDYGRGSGAKLITTQVLRDVSAWYHLVAVFDSSNATSSNRLKLYLNGSQITTFSTAIYPSQNALNNWMSANSNNRVGSSWDGSANFSGYITEVNFIDGQALTPSSFGETNAQTGVWQPKAYSGSYGTNGFYLNFSDNSNTTAATLGKDYSGNGNNWTPNNFSVTAGAGNDSLVDSPTSYGVDTGVGGTVRGNYSTLNPLSIVANASLSNGNLDATNTSGSNYRTFVSTMNLQTGSWYCEFAAGANTSGDNMFVGICPASAALSSTYIGSSSTSYAYSSNGTKYNNASATSYGASFTNGDVIGVAFDGSTLTFYKNGTSQGSAFTGLSGDFVLGVSLWGTAVCVANFGQRPFAYTAPSGFKALCTQNLPTPTIGATSTTLAGKYFNPVLYTGNSSTLAVTGVGFQPDWVWVKSRSAATDHGLYDAVRGVQKQLESNTTTAETTETTGITAFNSDGFTTGALAQLNTSSATYVAWNWKANGSGSTNTAGSITSTVSANTTSGFSIITWTGNATQGATIGHGLGAVPALFIIKNRSTAGTNWPVKTNQLSTNSYLYLNSNGASASFSFFWPNEPTSSIIYLGSNNEVNGSGNSMVCYAFAPVAGYSAFGSYTGNGSTDGPFIYTGFRPAYVMVKVTTAANVWLILDATRNTSNVVTLNLNADQSSAENTYSGWCDFTSNGFKVRGTDGAINTGSGTYIYMAFASNPFKYSLAR